MLMSRISQFMLMTTKCTLQESHEAVESRLKTQGQLALTWYKNFLLANIGKFRSPLINPRNLDADNKSDVLIIDDHWQDQ